MTESTPTFSCKCSHKKKHRLLMDGGVIGNYILELCDGCEAKQNKKFLIGQGVV